MKDEIFLSEEDKQFETLLKNHFLKKWDKIKSKDIILNRKEQEEFNNTIENAIKYRKLIKISKGMNFSSITIGKFLFLVRNKEKVSLELLASGLELDVNIINKIENREITDYSIPVYIVAKILINFHIKLKNFIQMLRNDLLLGTSISKMNNNYARSNRSLSDANRLKHIKQGIESFLINQKNKKKNEILIDENYINQIKSLIHKLGKDNLLIE